MWYLFSLSAGFSRGLSAENRYNLSCHSIYPFSAHLNLGYFIFYYTLTCHIFYLKHPILICHIHRGFCLHLNLVLSKSSTKLFSADCHTSYHLNLSQFSYNKSQLNVVILSTLSAENVPILSSIFPSLCGILSLIFPFLPLLHGISAEDSLLLDL